MTSDIDPYPTMLRLLRKYGNDGESLGRTFISVGLALEDAERPRRDDLAKMLNAWGFWGELGTELQSELIDCIEYTYGWAGPSRWTGFIKAHGTLPAGVRE